MPSAQRALKQTSSDNSLYLRQALIDRLRRDGIAVGSDEEAA
jgi:hypothetical protein